jgi:hypothetical protein
MSFKIVQSAHVLKIWCNTNYDLSTATSVSIMYEKPSGTTGTWVGTVEDGRITYTTSQNEIDEEGKWKFQASIVDGGDTITSVDIDVVDIVFVESLD